MTITDAAVIGAAIAGGIGASPTRPDAVAKVAGEFAFSSDLPFDDAVWGATLRSPHPHARIRSLDPTPALGIAGVHAVLTAADVPGQLTYGLITADQPVLADGVVLHQLGRSVPHLQAASRRHEQVDRRSVRGADDG